MTWFLGGIAFLILGYFTYGKLIDRFVGPDDRPTPAVRRADGVDFVPLPVWKAQLIQLLNIAGIGPVIGVIIGIKFGKIALLIIPIGCVFMGAVHDYLAGMMSVRHNGANLPRLVHRFLGQRYAMFFSFVTIILLLLVVAVFINVPAKIIDVSWIPQISFFWWAVGLIFVYYLLATLFPIDKIIGKVYPLFGALLIVGSVALAIALVIADFRSPDLLSDCAAFASYKAKHPLFPCLFVTIACGIISGFHATQSSLVARTLKSERQGRSVFFGMMILEGIIAMIWAAGALAIYNSDPNFVAQPPALVLSKITTKFLGAWMGGVTILAVVILAITSGDTALRSARLSLAESLKVNQVPIMQRIFTCLPLVALVALLIYWSNTSVESFNHIWHYFAWGNQILSVTTLFAGMIWMIRSGKGIKSLVAAVPGVFMMTVVLSYILWVSPDNGQPWGVVWKLRNGSLVNTGAELLPSILISAIVSVIVVIALIVHEKNKKHQGKKKSK